MQIILGPGTPPAIVRRRVRQVFRNYARYLIDVLCLPSMDRTELERAVDVVGWEHIPDALARSKGILLVTGHIGNWDVPAALLAARGFPVNVIVERLEPPAWNARVQAIRERAGLHAISMETGARQMFACLRRNEILALLIDRPLAEGGAPVHFFGRETRIPDGVARLALRTGASVVGAVGLRRGDRFVAVVSPPLQFEPTGDRERDVRALTQLVVDWLERHVRQHPSQWYMFRDMWPG
jgi:KDO2-lipid IV(A) lauroyltransferase